MADTPAPSTDPKTDPATDPAVDPKTDPATGDGLGDAGKKALDAERAARETSDRKAKDLQKELDALKQTSMSDSEKAVDEAVKKGKAEVTSAFGVRLVRSEFIAESAKRNPTFDTSKILDDLNLTKYVGEDGEPDSKAIADAVERLIPAPGDATDSFLQSLDLGGGHGTPKGKVDMSALIRKGAGKA